MSDEYFDPFEQSVSTEGVDAESVHESGGGQVSIAGRYHVKVQSVEYKNAEVTAERKSLPFMKIVMVVLAGENASEVNKKVYHDIYLAKWGDKAAGAIAPMEDRAAQSILAFLHAFGVVGDEVFGQEEVKLKREWFERLENQQAVVKVDMEEERKDEKTGKVYKPRPRIQWNNDVWPLTHDKVADVPKDIEAMQYAITGAASADALEDL